MSRPHETLADLAARLGVSEETAALFQRKPRDSKSSTLGKPRGASARLAAIAGPAVKADVAPVLVHRDEELLAAVVRVGELERANALLAIRVRVLTEQLDAAAPLLDESACASVEMERELAQLRAEDRRGFWAASARRFDQVRGRRRQRWARGGARMRSLRIDLRLARLMLARLQGRLHKPGGKLALVGGREQLRARLAELPRVRNPYCALGDFE